MIAIFLLLLSALQPPTPDSIEVEIRMNFPDGRFYLEVEGDPSSLRKFVGTTPVRVRPPAILRISHRHHQDRLVRIPTSMKNGTVVPVEAGPQFRNRGQYRSSWFVHEYDADLFVETDADTRIWVGDSLVGVGSGRYRVDFADGRYSLLLELESVMGYRRQLVHSEQRWFLVRKSLRAKPMVSHSLLFYPGLTQFYRRESVKALAFFAVTSAALGSFLYHDARYADRNRTYEAVVAEYRNAADAQALTLARRATALRDQVSVLGRYRDASMLLIGTTYALHLFDGIRPPRVGYRGEVVSVDPLVTGLGAGVSVSF